MAKGRETRATAEARVQLRDLALAVQGRRLYRQAESALDVGAAWRDAGDEIASLVTGLSGLGYAPPKRDVDRRLRRAREASAGVLSEALAFEVLDADRTSREVLRAGLPTPEFGEAKPPAEGPVTPPPDPFVLSGDISVKLGGTVVDAAEAEQIAFADFHGEKWPARIKSVEKRARGDVFRLIGRAKAAEWSTDELARRIRQSFGVAGSRARMIAQTELQRVSHQVAEKVWASFGDIVAGYEYLAAWERTCVECGADDGRVFRADEDRPVLPRHPRCACGYAPVARTWRELGIPVDEISPPGRTLAGYKFARGRVTWRDWIKDQPSPVQREVLGKKRYDLWAKKGKSKKALGQLPSPAAVKRKRKR